MQNDNGAQMNTVNLNVNHLKASLICAAKDDIRYYMNGVLVEILPREVRLVATDGHRLSILRRENRDNESDNAPAQIIVPRESLKGIKAVKGDEDCVLTYDPANLLAECSLSALADGGRTFKPIDGKFPDYLRVAPEKCSGEMGTFNPYYIADFTDLIRTAFGEGRDSNLWATVHHSGETGSAAVTAPGHPEFLGVVMSMRGTGDEYARPAWLDAKAKPEKVRKAA